MVIMKEHPQQVVDYLVNELENIGISGTVSTEPVRFFFFFSQPSYFKCDLT